MVCVRFLRTQQCAKSQCLLVLDQMAGWVPFPGFVWLLWFWIFLASMILAGICLFQVWRLLLVGGCRVTLTESLILAQDERWRRA
jgi:hypothetical protein